MNKLKTILLKFSGPLQSWGTGSHFETRRTDFYPSKSAVIGIIAASFGYKRDQDEKIIKLNELDFALRIDQEGSLLKDYHIAQKFDSRGAFDRTYVTNRYYLEDYIFIVSLSHNDDKFIDDIEKALRRPYFQPYMGRRSNSLPMDFLLGVFNENPVDILNSYEWQASNWYKNKFKNKKVNLEIIADSHLIDRPFKSLRNDRVISFSQKERKFGYRYESKDNVEFIYNKENKFEHDILNAIGE